MCFLKIRIWGIILICRLEMGYYLYNSGSFDFCLSFPFFWSSHMYWYNFRGRFTTRHILTTLPQLHFHLPEHPRSAWDNIFHYAFFVISVKGASVCFQSILVGFIFGFLNDQGHVFVKYRWKTGTWWGLFSSVQLIVKLSYLKWSPCFFLKRGLSNCSCRCTVLGIK